ncbi:MAG TPA: TolC family outer membrane protein [Methylococcaceae bacterium]|nr:TolC family outer membrane protein [Methylococcaceae bacterium]
MRTTLSVSLIALLSALAEPAQALNLLEAYDLAVRNDPSLQQAAAARQAVMEAKPQSLSRLLPAIAAQGTVTDVNQNSKTTFIPNQNGVIDSFWNVGINLNMQQPVYHHDYWVRLGQADSQIAQAQAEYAAEEQSLVTRTVNAYLFVLAGEDNLRFSTMEKEAIARQLEQAQQRFEVGLIAITDVHEAQAAYDQAVASEIEAQQVLDDKREALREIVAEPVEAIVPLAEEMPLLTPEPAGIDEWNNKALESNPNVIAADYAVEVARKEIDAQRAGHYPTLDLVSQFSALDSSRDTPSTDESGNPITRKLGPRSETATVGLELNIPLFQGGFVTSRTREAGFRLEAAQQGLDKQRRATVRAVKDAYRGVLSSIERVHALKSAVVSSQSALEAAEAGMEVGTRTMVDVLAEQRNLYRAMRDYAEARYKYINYGFSLKQEIGALNRDDVETANHWMNYPEPTPPKTEAQPPEGTNGHGDSRLPQPDVPLAP